MSEKLKEQVLRDFGDQGADTLKRYHAQIQYTLYWCIRMPRNCEGIEAVIPGEQSVKIWRRGDARGKLLVRESLLPACSVS